MVEFGDTIDPEASRRARRPPRRRRRIRCHVAGRPRGGGADLPLRAHRFEFDPDATTQDELLAALPREGGEGAIAPPSIWRLPVLMRGEAAEGIEDAAAALDISADTLREIFLGGRYQLGMFGFAPGFAYLSGIDPRAGRAAPAGAAAADALRAASSSPRRAWRPWRRSRLPTGWYVIGRTPVPLFDLAREPMTPFRVGDTITFDAIADDAAFGTLAAREDGGLSRR
ncbi:MAG: 5-oxoprolinase subunit PxpB [Acuticoccus sp.]